MATAEQNNSAEILDKNVPGRGYVVIIYGLYLASIMAVVTAPIGALIAHLRIGRGAAWVDTHLRFQIRTFWLGVLAALAAVILWRLLGFLNLAPLYAWIFGYLFFTAGIAWMMGRCGVGIHRLTNNRPIDAPASWFFGIERRALQD